MHTGGVYHLSTKTENSGWKFKRYSSFHRKVSGKDGNLQTYSSFPVPTGMTGKSLYHLWTPTRPGSPRRLFPPFTVDFSKWLPLYRGLATKSRNRSEIFFTSFWMWRLSRYHLCDSSLNLNEILKFCSAGLKHNSTGHSLVAGHCFTLWKVS